MEKFNRIPNNRVGGIKFEAYYEYGSYGGSFLDYGKERSIRPKIRANLEISIDIREEGDHEFIKGLQAEGLGFVAKMGFDVDKFRFVINEGMQRLPILLKHQDPDIAKIAWILSKYFSQRNDIIPEKIVE